MTSPVTASTFLPPLAAALAQRGWEPLVVSAPGPELMATMRSRYRTVEIPWSRSPSPLSDLRALWLFVTLLRRVRPAAVLAATPKAGLLAVMAARVVRVPLIVNLLWGLRSESLTGASRAAVFALESLTMRGSDVVVPNSKSLAGLVARLGMVRKAKIQVLGHGSSHGVDLKRFQPSSRQDRAPVTVGFVGRIRRDKGVNELLAAFAECSRHVPDVQLRLVGQVEEAALAGQIARLCETACVEHVPHTETIEDEYARMDLVCLPSWREGFPNVCLEAAACGLPVVTTDATGARDAVIDQVTGLRVPRHNVAALARALRGLCVDSGRRREMGRAGRAWVEREFDSRLVCGQFADFVGHKLQ